MSGSHPPVSVHVQPCPPMQRCTPACAPAGPQPRLQSCQGSGGSTLRCRPFHSIASSSAPSASLFREGRRRRDGATGTTGTGLLLMHNGGDRISCTFPSAHRCARSEPARGSARLLTVRTSARPDFLFSRLISRLDCADCAPDRRSGRGPAVAWRVHNGRAVGTPKKRLRRERQALKCAPSTRHPAGQELPSAAFQRAALRTSSTGQERKPVIGMRSVAHVQGRPGRQVGVDRGTSNAQLSSQQASQRVRSAHDQRADRHATNDHRRAV